MLKLWSHRTGALKAAADAGRDLRRSLGEDGEAIPPEADKASSDAVWCNAKKAYEYRGIRYQLRDEYLVCTLPSVTLGSSPADANPMISVTTSVVIDGSWMFALETVWKKFKASHDDVKCFYVSAKIVDETMIIDLVPKWRKSETDPIGGRTECGQGITYVVNQEGKVLRKYFAK